MIAMPAVYIEDLKHHLGEEVTLRGWLYNRRSSGKLHFLLVRDGTGICQCVAPKADLGDEAFTAADHMGQETSLEVVGVAREDKRAPGGIELTAKSTRSCEFAARSCKPAAISFTNADSCSSMRPS
jgi:asparaginyl-tRNA synthetase